jgi:hypothetical protein
MPSAAAQGGPVQPAQGYSTTPVFRYGPAAPLELTYTNLAYGMSLRFPSNFEIRKSSSFNNGASSNIPGYVDPGGILLAEVIVPEAFWEGTNAGGIIFLAGVNPRLSAHACSGLLESDGDISGPVGTMNVDSIDFKWREEVEGGRTRGSQIQLRSYTGYSNGICYEFQISWQIFDSTLYGGRRLGSLDASRVFDVFDAIIQTIKIDPANPKRGGETEHITQPWETSLPFPKELAGLGDLADWDVRYPTGGGPMSRFPGQFRICGTGDQEQLVQISFSYEANPSLDNAAANAEIDNLNVKVTQFIEENGWQSIKSASGSQPSELEGCYAKDTVFFDIGKGTYGSSVDVFIPAPQGNPQSVRSLSPCVLLKSPAACP